MRSCISAIFLVLASFFSLPAAAESIHQFAGVYYVATSTRNEYRLAVLPINDEYGITIALHQTKGVTVERRGAYVFRECNFNESTNTLDATLVNNLYVMQSEFKEKEY